MSYVYSRVREILALVISLVTIERIKAMRSKQARTIERYMKAGAEMRLFKSLGARLITDLGSILLTTDQDKLIRAFRKIQEVCSNAEDNMFKDYPNLSNDYIDVFYGDVGNEPRNEVDKQIISKAKEVSDGLFERKGN